MRLFAAALLTCPAMGQEVLRTHYGILEQAYGIRSVEDIDRDSVPDYAIRYDGPDAIRFFSGATGDALFEYVGAGSSSVIRGYDTVGDYNGDGYVDFLIGHPQFYPGGGAVLIYSGLDGSVLSLVNEGGFSFGDKALSLGDINLDGHPDFAGGVLNAFLIYLGPDSRLVRTHVNSSEDAQLDVLDDIDGDGAPDYVIGYRTSSAGTNRGGRVMVHSGMTGDVIYDFLGEEEDLELGYSVSRAGDMNGDGTCDFWVGAPRSMQSPDHPGEVRLYSGANGSVLQVIETRNQILSPDFEYSDHLGKDVYGGEDVNGDGVPDVLTVARLARWNWDGNLPVNGDNEAISVLSGATGQRIFQEMGNHDEGSLGRLACQALLGDLDGDGLSEWAVAYRFPTVDNPTGFGRVHIFRGAPADAFRACSTSPNSLGLEARLECPNSISPRSEATRFQAMNVPAGEAGVFFYGDASSEVPFGDGTLCVGGGEVFRLSGPIPAFDWNVALFDPDLNSLQLSTGPGALVAGSTWRFQYWYRDPASILTGGSGFNLTDALDVTFAP